MSEEYALAFTETLYIINSSSEEDKRKIPQDFIQFLLNNCNRTYRPNIDFTKPVKDLKIRKETKWLLSLIYSSYLANDEQKQEFNQILDKNYESYTQEQREKYDIHRIFEQEQKNNEQNPQRLQANVEVDTKKADMVELKKESIFTRFLNKIKKLFRR